MKLLGFDFMIDSNFRLYLLEVNTNPCLEQSTEILTSLIYDLVDNTFR